MAIDRTNIYGPSIVRPNPTPFPPHTSFRVNGDFLQQNLCEAQDDEFDRLETRVTDLERNFRSLATSACALAVAGLAYWNWETIRPEVDKACAQMSTVLKPVQEAVMKVLSEIQSSGVQKTNLYGPL